MSLAHLYFDMNNVPKPGSPNLVTTGFAQMMSQDSKTTNSKTRNHPMRKVLLVAAVLLPATFTLAQDDLMSIYQQALQSNTDLAVAENNQEIAESFVDQGLARLLPDISGQVGWRAGGKDFDVDWDNNTTAYSITLKQALFNLQAFEAYNAGKTNAKAAESTLSDTKMSLMVDSVVNYLDVLTAFDNLNLAKAELTAVERQLEQTEQRYEVGMVAITNVLEARASFDASKVNLITAETNYDLALQKLALLTGSVPTNIKKLPESFKIPELPKQKVSDWVNAAMENNPSLTSVELNADYLDQLYGTKKAERFPTLGLEVTYEYLDYAEEFRSRDPYIPSRLDNGSTSVGIQLSVPIYTGGRLKSETLQSGLEYNNALQTLEGAKRNVELQVRTLVSTVENNKRTIEAQALAVESMKSALKATEVGYEVGTRNIVEVLDAQRQMFATELGYRVALYDLIKNQITLKQAVGVLSVNDLNAINLLLVE